MALDVHVAGPGLELTRRLQPGDPALIIGRDTDCAICLPDPERNISRRHLSVWNEGDQLQFHVLSVVNGVQTAAGELPPGARGVLASGEALVVWAFRVTAIAVAPADGAVQPPAEDPWAELERVAAQLAPGDPTTQLPPVEEDPFGEWGFQTTFGPGAAGGPLEARSLKVATDLQPFFAGLGLGAGTPAALTEGEMETIGRLTRIALHGLLQASQAAAASRQDMRPEDRTVAEVQQLNPLRMDTPVETKLSYLFGGQNAAAGFMAADRAVAQIAAELAAHEQAMAEAVREAVLGVLQEFEPEALKKRLLGGGARLFESARAWDAFVKDYGERLGQEPSWVQRLLDRQFARAYARALMRAKRNMSGRPPP